MDFQEQIRAAMARHTEFHPKTIDVAKAAQRAYEKRPEVKARRKAYAQSEAGHESMLRRSRKYAETHREKIAAKNRRWYAATIETRRAKCKEYREAHKAELAKKQREYRARKRAEKEAKKNVQGNNH